MSSSRIFFPRVICVWDFGFWVSDLGVGSLERETRARSSKAPASKSILNSVPEKRRTHWRSVAIRDTIDLVQRHCCRCKGTGAGSEGVGRPTPRAVEILQNRI